MALALLLLLLAIDGFRGEDTPCPIDGPKTCTVVEETHPCSGEGVAYDYPVLGADLSRPPCEANNHACLCELHGGCDFGDTMRSTCFQYFGPLSVHDPVKEDEEPDPETCWTEIFASQDTLDCSPWIDDNDDVWPLKTGHVSEEEFRRAILGAHGDVIDDDEDEPRFW